MIKHVIFDMDGTLFQTERILALSLEETFQDLRSRALWNGETPLEKYRSIMGVPLPEVWRTLLPNHPEPVREQTDAFFLSQLISNIKSGKGALYPDVEEVFHQLVEEGCSIYIASNGLKEYLHAIIEFYQLDRWVTETCSIQQIDSLNKGELVKQIVDKYGIEDGVVIGDRLSDFKAAKQNGLLSVGCDFDFAREEELAQADVVIDGLGELKTIIPSLRKQPEI
ncbi:HAD hydrolase-like protein [Sediminibacillus dalangtanensis]|uniref:HAD hydrolase-like protein n=1 Tax=Sediminibacillus dalangtanensis TaxID=2729421 RepID=A0ABX7W0C8_9BACI|nr:HAD hydrolase-like protein [Sediminibacillus dalangtanensis]QTN01594.1 HAD hydrolase-like protein [Sediminibacillus dalangtanensis]